MPTCSSGGAKTGLRYFKTESFLISRDWKWLNDIEEWQTIPNNINMQQYIDVHCGKFSSAPRFRGRLRAFPWTTWCSSSHRNGVMSCDMTWPMRHHRNCRQWWQCWTGRWWNPEFSVWWSLSIKMAGYTTFSDTPKCGQSLAELGQEICSLSFHQKARICPIWTPKGSVQSDSKLCLARYWKVLVRPCSQVHKSTRSFVLPCFGTRYCFAPWIRSEYSEHWDTLRTHSFEEVASAAADPSLTLQASYQHALGMA